jgi:hypothetical protein
MALVATVCAGFTKYRGQSGRSFLHLYRLALIREHYSRMRSYQCTASRNLCLICRQPYAVWLRLGARVAKNTNFERLTTGDGLGEPLRARRRPRSWRALNCQAQTPMPNALKTVLLALSDQRPRQGISTFDVAVAASFIPVMGRSISLRSSIIFGILRLGVSGCRQVRVID